jgi:hypothetical protein
MPGYLVPRFCAEGRFDKVLESSCKRYVRYSIILSDDEKGEGAQKGFQFGQPPVNVWGAGFI